MQSLCAKQCEKPLGKSPFLRFSRGGEFICFFNRRLQLEVTELPREKNTHFRVIMRKKKVIITSTVRLRKRNKA